MWTGRTARRSYLHLHGSNDDLELDTTGAQAEEKTQVNAEDGSLSDYAAARWRLHWRPHSRQARPPLITRRTPANKPAQFGESMLLQDPRPTGLPR
jgi:hypothetical protein